MFLERKSGVLMHISSLFGDYSIGSFGKNAKIFVDFLKECGFSYWQVLPLCPTDKFNSPYKSSSAFSGNPFFVDLETLAKEELVTHEELEAQKEKIHHTCEFERLHSHRIKLLETASKRAKNKAEIKDFVSKNPHLSDFCKFASIKSNNKNQPWFCWTNNNYDNEAYFMWEFIQFHFFKQWNDLKNYANSKGIEIIGDIPMYVDLDSSDVWANKQLFILDEKNRPLWVAGVPPDYFSQDGQLWGNPIYDWHQMEETNFKWWRDRIRHMTKMFDGVRIDHFRAIESFWEVPFGSPTAKFGKMAKGPGKKFIDAIKDETGNSFIIAEDLGFITQEVTALLDYSGFSGMRVFQFAFDGDKYSPHLPHNYSKSSVAYTGTHDNNTLIGYLDGLDESTQRYIFKYCGLNDGNIKEGAEHIIRTMMASHAGVVILPIQDLIMCDESARLNTPGTTKGNWEFRISKEQLENIDRKFFRDLNETYSRI